MMARVGTAREVKAATKGLEEEVVESTVRAWLPLERRVSILYIEGGDREFVPGGGEKGRVNRVVDSGMGVILAVVEMDAVVGGWWWQREEEMAAGGCEGDDDNNAVASLGATTERRAAGATCWAGWGTEGRWPQSGGTCSSGTTTCQRGERPAGGRRRQVPRGREWKKEVKKAKRRRRD
jgi:hypothetical protein